MTTNDETKYEDLCYFIANSGSPARGGRYLLSFEEVMNETAPPKNENEARFRRYATGQYQAVMNLSPLATNEQVEYCRRTREEMEKWRSMYDAGWKTSAEEGYDAFDPKALPADWDGTSNPYPPGAVDHDEWDDGYSEAIMSAGAESAGAHETLDE